ncbi:hypothetical protein H9Q74_006068 [Fusarium xylarioides]|nr:hypothetical protein H9Q71_004945 [Fusarium xylarioides]KAG5823839.1 hypothetical protein H9Q74_006068 [Fusarium xylarioides]
MDAVGVAGLTIAVLDQLWKLGDRTAELVANFRSFDSDTRTLETKICDESNRTRALQKLLFDKSSTYGGKALFEQFDSDVQEQIQVLLEQASDILDQAYKVLSRTLGSPVKGSGFLNSDSANTDDLESKPPGSFQRLRWSFSSKKRVEAIVREFSEYNDRIHENVKLWCLGTSIGVNLQHLQRLETDINSRVLGFDVDARLQLANQENRSTKILEMSGPQLHRALVEIQPIGENFGIFRLEGKPMLAEYRSYAADSPVPVELDDRTRDLVDKLANLLHQPKEVIFRTPRCQGWVRQIQHNRVAYLFNIPAAADTKPITLLDVLNATPPSLSQKFCLATKLSRCISQLQLVQWVHESFRSENIVFFPQTNTPDAGSNPEGQIDFAEPWVFGFEFSRPEAYFSQGAEDTCLARNIYRHPDRQLSPTQIFNKIHDIYALGVVLLEVGLWQPATSLEKYAFTKVQDPQAIKRRLIQQAEKRLGSKMGDRYKSVVLKCLQGDFAITDDTKEDLKLQQAFRAHVVDVLQKATASI